MEENIITTLSWLIPLISGIAGAIVGTFGGAFFVYRFQRSDKVAIRKIAVRAVKIFKKYNRRTYADAQGEFNTSLNLSEKRAVLVVLHKLGIPIEIPASNAFNIKEIQFSPKIVIKDDIDDIIYQLNNGHCDNLFFSDIDEYFSSNLRLTTLRELAKRYVEKVMAQSKFVEPNQILHIPNWEELFSPGELQSILVFREQVRYQRYYNKDGNANSEMLKHLLKEIEIGLWDGYLFWDITSYQNIQNQNLFVSLMSSQLMNSQINNCNQQSTPQPPNKNIKNDD